MTNRFVAPPSRSKPSVVEYHTFFTMSRVYTHEDEAALYDRIKTVLRARLGNRNYMAQLPGQTSLQAFRTMSLQSTGRPLCHTRLQYTLYCVV